MALCEKDIEGLLRLESKADEFIQEVFDWVAPLKKHELLGQLYDFQRAIRDQIQFIEKESEK